MTVGRRVRECVMDSGGSERESDSEKNIQFLRGLSSRLCSCHLMARVPLDVGDVVGGKRMRWGEEKRDVVHGCVGWKNIRHLPPPPSVAHSFILLVAKVVGMVTCP